MDGVIETVSAPFVMDCTNKWKEVWGGAAVTAAGLDFALPAPPFVHWGLGGIAASYMCGNSDVGINYDTGYSFGWGVLGGILFNMARVRFR